MNKVDFGSPYHVGQLVEIISDLQEREAELEDELQKWRTGHQLHGVYEDLYTEVARRIDAEKQAEELKKVLEMVE